MPGSAFPAPAPPVAQIPKEYSPDTAPPINKRLAVPYPRYRGRPGGAPIPRMVPTFNQKTPDPDADLAEKASTKGQAQKEPENISDSVHDLFDQALDERSGDAASENEKRSPWLGGPFSSDDPTELVTSMASSHDERELVEAAVLDARDLTAEVGPGPDSKGARAMRHRKVPSTSAVNDLFVRRDTYGGDKRLSSITRRNVDAESFQVAFLVVCCLCFVTCATYLIFFCFRYCSRSKSSDSDSSAENGFARNIPQTTQTPSSAPITGAPTNLSKSLETVDRPESEPRASSQLPLDGDVDKMTGKSVSFNVGRE